MNHLAQRRFLTPLFAILTIAIIFATLTSIPTTTVAQDEDTTAETDASDTDTSTDTPSSSSSGGKKKAKRTIFRMLFSGNPLGTFVVILLILLSFLSVYCVIEHFITINKNKVMPDIIITELEQRIARGEIDDAIEFCRIPDNFSLSTEVILAGLERYRGTEFGFAEYKNAIEEAGEDQTGALYRKTEVLGVIGAIAPMLGLTGTVLGMISAFNTLADEGGFAKPDQLAGGIGDALITTLLGLVVAIPTMVAYSFFRNKIDSLVAEAGKRIERVMLPLGRKNR